MPGTPFQGRALLYRRAARICGGVAAALGGIVLVGWIAEIPTLKSVAPRWVTMKANTALAFLALGSSLVVLPGAVGLPRRCALGVAALGLAIGMASLSEYVFSVDPGIDQLLFREDAAAVGTSHPGRMAPATALGFTLLGSAVLLAARGRVAVSAGLAIGGGALGLLNFLGYLYGVPKLYGIAATTQMAVHTAIGLMLLSSSTMMAWTERGPMSTTVADGPGGAFARLLIPIAVAVPALLGLACVQAQRHGWLGPELGVGLLVLLIVFPMVGFVWGVAAHVQAVDDARRRDAEELARLAAALSDRSRELELANRELESFNYSASHDLRAPLRAIDGFSRVVHDRYANLLDAEGRGYLERVRANAQRMGQIIDDLLRLSRLSRQELHVAEVDLAELARAVVGRLREAEPTRSVGVRIPDRVPAHGDLSLLDVALQNLLGNAWKFTGTKAEARIEFGVGSRGGHAAFFVRDDGAGFDPGYAARLFQPFQRLHSAAEFPGTGIGLATVQRIVHRHGGEVWAEGKPGEGATFWFTLPGSEGAAP